MAVKKERTLTDERADVIAHLRLRLIAAPPWSENYVFLRMLIIEVETANHVGSVDKLKKLETLLLKRKRLRLRAK